MAKQTKTKKRKPTRLAFELAMDLDRRLEKLAAETGTTKAQLIRKALSMYALTEEVNDDPDRKKN
jgi:predicted DNA-binding protein